jgi:hypothetical protein
MICFQAVLLLLQQNQKYKVHILANLPHLDTAVNLAMYPESVWTISRW